MPSPAEFPPLHTLLPAEIDAIIAQQRANRPLPQTIGKAKKPKPKPRKDLSITLEDLRLLFPTTPDEDLSQLLIGTPPHPDDEANSPAPLDEPDPSDEDEEDDEDDEDDEES
jgi:hypothetical protein